MKTLLAIYIAAVLAGLGTYTYILHEINNMVQYQPGGSSIEAINSHAMQPFGQGQEDDDTAQLHVQPTRSPMVTRHYYLLQGDTTPVQGSSPELEL